MNEKAIANNELRKRTTSGHPKPLWGFFFFLFLLFALLPSTTSLFVPEFTGGKSCLDVWNPQNEPLKLAGKNDFSDYGITASLAFA